MECIGLRQWRWTSGDKVRSGRRPRTVKDGVIPPGMTRHRSGDAPGVLLYRVHLAPLTFTRFGWDDEHEEDWKEEQTVKSTQRYNQEHGLKERTEDVGVGESQDQHAQDGGERPLQDRHAQGVEGLRNIGTA